MKAKRRRHDPEFKARVALEALKGIKPIQQIAKEFDIQPVQVSEWKKLMLEGATRVFQSGHAKSEAEDFEAERTKLHSKIGQLAVEVDFLTRKSGLDSQTYLSYVSGSIMLSVSALEAEIWSLFKYGPGYHLGT